MKRLILAVALVWIAMPSHAQQYPAHSWTYNVDFKDPEAIDPFVGREVLDGQWKAGVSWSPVSVYHVSEADAEATRWLRLGGALTTNAEKLNATFGPTIGLDVLRWTNQAKIAGPLESGARWWKVLGYASWVASVNFWGGWTPVHTSDVAHNYGAGFGFALKARFGSSAFQAANDLIKSGL